MKARNSDAATVTTGILIGHEIGEWAGVTFGRLILKKDDGERSELRLGRESLGEIPKIGSLIAVEHTKGTLPEILKIEIIKEPKSTFHQAISKPYESSLFFAELNSLVMCVLTEVIIGLLVILMGLFSGLSDPMALIIFGLCGIPHIIIAYLIWNKGGQ